MEQESVMCHQEHKSPSASSTAVHAHSVSCGADELLLVAKAFIKVSCHAKHSTERKVEKFWEEVSSAFEEYIVTSNKMNKSNPDYSPIEYGCGAELLQNCWQCRLQPTVQKFAGIIYSYPPTSGEVCDDALMDLYYTRMHHECQACSKSYPKDMSKTFDKLMKSYYFLSKHPKFKVEFPTDGSKSPP
jgi:hypothetical protein